MKWCGLCGEDVDHGDEHDCDETEEVGSLFDTREEHGEE
jgi:hypothetical protein